MAWCQLLASSDRDTFSLVMFGLGKKVITRHAVQEVIVLKSWGRATGPNLPLIIWRDGSDLRADSGRGKAIASDDSWHSLANCRDHFAASADGDDEDDRTGCANC